MTSGATRRVAATVFVAGALAAGGCGKKGPPLAPFVRVPAAVDKMAAVRLGQHIYVTLTVPAVNVDMSVPVDIVRVEVYGYTGAAAPARPVWIDLGTLVATIPVSPLPGEPPEATDPSVDSETTDALPGTAVTILDVLEADELVQGPVVTVPQRTGLPVLPAPTTPPVLRRFYIAVPFSQAERPGPPGQQAEVALTAVPDPPGDLQVTYDPTAVHLTWEPSGGLLGFLLNRLLPQEPPPFDVVELSPTPTSTATAPAVPALTTYQVYREVFPDAVAPSEKPLPPPWSATLPVPMNATPVSAPALTDGVEFGLRRCYTVRAQRGGVLSEASPPACVTPIDTFPPASPVGLAAVPSEGAINLIWEPNVEGDLGGYLVLRSGPRDATLRQLTSVPVPDARYRDTTVESGVRYTYAIVAVDRQSPRPNASVPSAPVEEVAR